LVGVGLAVGDAGKSVAEGMDVRVVVLVTVGVLVLKTIVAPMVCVVGVAVGITLRLVPLSALTPIIPQQHKITLTTTAKILLLLLTVCFFAGGLSAASAENSYPQ